MANSSRASPHSSNGRLIETARTMASLARHLTRIVRGTVVASALAGGTVWALLWWPAPGRAIPLLAAMLTLLGLLGPAAVLGLFYAGLRNLATMPDRVSTHAVRTARASAATYEVATQRSNGWLGRVGGLIRQVWALRSLLVEHRTLLLRYGSMLRLLTPAFLLLVVGALGATVVLLGLATTLGLLAVLF